MTTRRILVTGASSGIGQAIAQRLHAAGHQVYGTSRQPGAVAPYGMIAMDVTDDDSVRAGVAAVEGHGAIDVLINNAGFGLAGAVEDTSPAELMSQLDTNLLGPLRVMRSVLPAMRARRRGLIINIGSIGGRIAIPFQGAYSASKFALEGLSEALSIEVRPFGIHVVVVQPGDHRSSFTERRRFTDTAATSAYAERTRKSIAIMAASEQNGPPPERVARAVERLVASSKPPLRVVVGSPLERLGLLLQRFLPGRTFEGLIAGTYDKP